MLAHIYEKVYLIKKLYYEKVYHDNSRVFLGNVPDDGTEHFRKDCRCQGEPLAFANVVLLNRQDSTFVNGAVSGENGCFSIDSSCSVGILKITSVGYKTIFKDYKGENVGVIKMEEDSKMLDEVVIKSSLPKTVLKNGGMMTTIVGSVLEKAGTMEHLLDRIPNVSAQNGNIKVFGRGEPIIYINGRQMRDRSELDRLSSDNIKSVEVISTQVLVMLQALRLLYVSPQRRYKAMDSDLTLQQKDRTTRKRTREDMPV